MAWLGEKMKSSSPAAGAPVAPVPVHGTPPAVDLSSVSTSRPGVSVSYQPPPIQGPLPDTPPSAMKTASRMMNQPMPQADLSGVAKTAVQGAKTIGTGAGNLAATGAQFLNNPWVGTVAKGASVINAGRDLINNPTPVTAGQVGVDVAGAMNPLVAMADMGARGATNVLGATKAPGVGMGAFETIADALDPNGKIVNAKVARSMDGKNHPWLNMPTDPGGMLNPIKQPNIDRSKDIPAVAAPAAAAPAKPAAPAAAAPAATGKPANIQYAEQLQKNYANAIQTGTLGDFAAASRALKNYPHLDTNNASRENTALREANELAKTSATATTKSAADEITRRNKQFEDFVTNAAGVIEDKDGKQTPDIRQQGIIRELAAKAGVSPENFDPEALAAVKQDADLSKVLYAKNKGNFGWPLSSEPTPQQATDSATIKPMRVRKDWFDLFGQNVYETGAGSVKASDLSPDLIKRMEAHRTGAAQAEAEARLKKKAKAQEGK